LRAAFSIRLLLAVNILAEGILSARHAAGMQKKCRR
jgi:hypothetical protein